MNRIPVGLVLGLVMALLAGEGCRRPTIQKVSTPSASAKPDPQAVQFYDALVAVQRIVDDGYQALGTRLSQMMSGQAFDRPPSLAELRKLREEYRQAIATAQKNLEKLGVPELKGASELYKAQQKAIQAERVAVEAADKVLTGVEDMFTRPGMFNPVELQGSIETLQTIRKDTQAELAKARQQFSQTHRLGR